MNSNKVILHLCADTGSDSKPYKDAGYNVVCVGKKTGVENFNPSDKVYGIIANPVCTEFSTARSGGKAGNIKEGMLLVNECLRIINSCCPKFWVIENPAKGKLKDFLGKPKFIYEPWEFGSPWTKKTALWGEFNIPKKKYARWEDVPKIEGLYQRVGRKPALVSMHKSHCKLIKEFSYFKPETDAEFRSLCSQNFAKAFYEVNQ